MLPGVFHSSWILAAGAVASLPLSFSVHFKSPFPVNSLEMRDVHPSLFVAHSNSWGNQPFVMSQGRWSLAQVSHANPASVALIYVLVVTCGRCRNVSVLAGGYKHRATCCVRCLLGICGFAFCFFRGGDLGDFRVQFLSYISSLSHRGWRLLHYVCGRATPPPQERQRS